MEMVQADVIVGEILMTFKTLTVLGCLTGLLDYHVL